MKKLIQCQNNCKNCKHIQIKNKNINDAIMIINVCIEIINLMIVIINVKIVKFVIGTARVFSNMKK